jgi:thiamine pyrophosphate-dependent acetolactate synthase large subunit-like protein
MGDVRWDRVAEGLGCRSAYVERREDLADALARARAAETPTGICVRTDRDANLAAPPELHGRFVEVYQGPLG